MPAVSTDATLNKPHPFIAVGQFLWHAHQFWWSFYWPQCPCVALSCTAQGRRSEKARAGLKTQSGPGYDVVGQRLNLFIAKMMQIDFFCNTRK